MKRFVVINVIILLFALAILPMACERFYELVVENQTTQALTISVDNAQSGRIEPGTQTSIRKIPSEVNRVLIIAKTDQGETVFSGTLTRQQMQHVTGSDTFKVVIVSPEGNLKSSDNVTGK